MNRLHSYPQKKMNFPFYRESVRGTFPTRNPTETTSMNASDAMDFAQFVMQTNPELYERWQSNVAPTPECPICYDTCSDDAVQCSNGHVACCNTCKTKMLERGSSHPCPVCRKTDTVTAPVPERPTPVSDEEMMRRIRERLDEYARNGWPGLSATSEVSDEGTIDFVNGMRYVTFNYRVRGDTTEFWCDEETVLYEIGGEPAGRSGLRFYKNTNWLRSSNHNTFPVQRTCHGLLRIYKLRRRR